MAKKKIIYGNYYKAGQKVTLGIRFAGTKALESNGEITSLRDDLVTVEILGEMPAVFSEKKGNTRFSISGWSGWGFFCCDALREGAASPKELVLRLVGEVEEKQRREYFRLDVFLPVVFEIPVNQSPGAIREQWSVFRAESMKNPPALMLPSGRGYRAVLPGGVDIPAQPVNLSGGGLRVRMSSAVPLGELVHVRLYLPLAPPRTVNAVAQVLRCNEITLRLEKDPAFITAMKFIHIDEKDREAVIAYLFTEQRIQLQNEAERDKL